MSSSWILMRHGARAPVQGKFLTLGVKSIEEEAHLWRRLLPEKEVISHLLKEHPAKHSQGLAYRRPRDADVWPYGALTKNGLDQASRVQGGEKKRIVVGSTNYLRTMLTAAAASRTFGLKSGEIRVRGVECGLNGFDAFPKETKKALQETSKNLEKDEPNDLKRALIDAIPGATHENFTWLYAVDYAECRLAHNLPSYNENLLLEARKYLRERYFHIFRHRKIASLVSAPALIEIRRGLSSSHCVLNAAHDITILAILHGLKAKLPRGFALPPFCSSFHINVQHETSTLSVSLNDQPIRVDDTILFNYSLQKFQNYLDDRIIQLQQPEVPESTLDQQIPSTLLPSPFSPQASPQNSPTPHTPIFFSSSYKHKATLFSSAASL